MVRLLNNHQMQPVWRVYNDLPGAYVALDIMDEEYERQLTAILDRDGWVQEKPGKRTRMYPYPVLIMGELIPEKINDLSLMLSESVLWEEEDVFNKILVSEYTGKEKMNKTNKEGTRVIVFLGSSARMVLQPNTGVGNAIELPPRSILVVKDTEKKWVVGMSVSGQPDRTGSNRLITMEFFY